MTIIRRELVSLLEKIFLTRSFLKFYRSVRYGQWDRSRAWWEFHSGRQQSFVTKIHPGIKMRLYFDSQLSKLIHYENFEWQERKFILSFLRKGDIFLDIGANIGLFTIIAGRCVGKTGHVFSFEPHHKTFVRLLDNVVLNRLTSVSCFEEALSDSNAEKDLTVSSDGYDAWNSFGKPTAGSQFAIEKVKCITLDDFVEKYNLFGQITMAKIDVEGWEVNVLRGGYKTLSRNDAPILQVEFTDANAQAAGSSCRKLYDVLEEFGYQMFVYHPQSKKIIHDLLRQDYPYVNLIAVKQSRLSTSRLKDYL